MLNHSSNTFRYEYQMIPHIENGLIETLPYLKSSKNVLKGYEISLGWGVADLVLCPQEKNNMFKPVTSLLAIQVLYSMKKNEELDLEQIYQRTLIKKNILNGRVIYPLLNSGYIEECGDKYKKVSDIKVETRNLIAVEAKLRDWRRAFKQALRYRLFANRVFVVLANSNIKPLIKNGGLEMYREEGIGLATVDTHGSLQMLLEAKKNKPFSFQLGILARQLLEFNQSQGFSPDNLATI